MKTKTLIGKRFHREAIPEDLFCFLPDDFELPCYRVTIPFGYVEPSEQCYYYADIFVDGNGLIQKVERFKDNYLTNYPVPRFPSGMEGEFEEMISKAIDSD